MPEQDVADVEEPIQDDAAEADVYHVNQAEISSSEDFIEGLKPTVTIVSDGSQFGHPRRAVIDGILAVSPSTEVYLINRNPSVSTCLVMLGYYGHYTKASIIPL